MNTLLLLLALHSFSSSAAPIEAKHEACPNPHAVETSDVTLETKTPAGTVYFCGGDSAAEFHGNAYLAREKSFTDLGPLGGANEGYAPFSLETVRLEGTCDGVLATKTIPFRKGERVHTFQRKLTCDAKGCHWLPETCVFKKPKGKVDLAAYRRLKPAWEKPQLSWQGQAAAEGVSKDLAKLTGEKKAPAKADGDDYNDDIMRVYRNALLGHAPSRRLLLDEKIQSKLRKYYEDAGEAEEGASFEMVNLAIAPLVRAGCLR